MMGDDDVLDVVGRVEAAGVPVWLDGGWGVDSLVGERTRVHDDLDVVIAADRAEAVIAVLAPLGYALVEDERPTRFVLAASGNRRVDVHPVTFDAEGGGTQVLRDGTAWRYPAEGLAGEGRVGGWRVRCLSAEVQVLAHLGYSPDGDDRHDMRLLRDRLGVRLPPSSG